MSGLEQSQQYVSQYTEQKSYCSLAVLLFKSGLTATFAIVLRGVCLIGSRPCAKSKCEGARVGDLDYELRSRPALGMFVHTSCSERFIPNNIVYVIFVFLCMHLAPPSQQHCYKVHTVIARP